MKVKEMATKCELALTGKVVETTDTEVQAMIPYLLNAMGIDENYSIRKVDVFKDRIQKWSKNHVTHVCTNMVWGMPCITFLLKADEDDEEGYPAPFEEDYGCGYPCAFCYVFNPTADEMCSEFGDCFFEKRPDGFYYRKS